MSKSNILYDKIIDLQLKIEKVVKHRDILTDALSEIQATIDGNSNQDIRIILEGCIAEVKELEINNEKHVQ